MNDIERVVIEESCRQLIHRYADSIDARDLDRLVSVFADDFVWVRPNMAPMRTHADVRAFFENLWDTRTKRNPHYLDLHLITTCCIEVDSASRATGSSKCIMFSNPNHDGKGPASTIEAIELVATYRNIFAKTSSGWRIVEHQAEHLFRSPRYETTPVPEGLKGQASPT